MFKRRCQVAKKNYSISDLPSNRKEVLLDLLRYRFDIFIRIGLILLLFALPILLVIFVNQILINESYNQYLKHIITEQEHISILNSYRNVKNILLVLAFIIFSIALSGVIRIVKMLIWYDIIFFTSDFLTGLKQNFKHISIVSLALGIVNFINGYIMGIKISGENSELLSWLLNSLPLGLTIIVLLPVSLIMISSVSIYSNSLLVHIKNSVVIFLRSFLRTILIALALSSPLSLLLINNVIVRIIIILIIIILYLPILIMIWQLYCNKLFDKYINEINYPELVDKGIKTNIERN